MLRLAVITAVGALSAAGAARALMVPPAPVPAAALQLRGPANYADAFTTAQAPRGPDGQYWAQGESGGARLRFVVDTGASVVALTQADARRVGLDPDSLTYDVRVHTAGGEARGAHVHLTSLSVGDARVDNVDAVVVQQGLRVSLLGMSYLGRLSSFEATPHALIFRP